LPQFAAMPRRPEEGRLTNLSPSSSLAYADPDVRSAVTDAEPVWLGLRLSAWVKIGVVAGLFLALFWPNLRRLWDKTNPIYGEPNWGHAVCVPLIGLYYLFTNREELLRQPARASWSGLPFLVLGILLFAYGIWPGQNDFVKDFGMVVTLFGAVLLLSGWSVMRVAWFPIAYLVCAIPWPGLVYSWIAGPLQVIAARAAVFTLRITGVQAHNYGTKIEMIGEGGALRTLNVAEACAGLRSLMTFITVGAAVAFLSARPLWQKIVVTASAIPIAIFCNTMRVSVQGILDYYWSREVSEGFAHQFVGMVMLVPAFFLILLVGWVLDNLFIEEVDEETLKDAAAPATRQPAIRGAIVDKPHAAPVAAAPAAAARIAPATAKASSSATAGAAPLVIEVPRHALTRPKKPATPTASPAASPQARKG
jgi:exosortase